MHNKENSKRIAQNTLLLYIRMLFTMAVGLFTSREILSTLGIEDYGVYNVVGGFVLMFSFFTASLSTAISRFITYELGRKEYKRLNIIFSTSINVILALSIGIIIIAEILGIWFLNTKLNIPEERMYAANWVFQFALLSFIFNFMNIPYNASIIAHEKMNAYAYISILEVTLKLVIVYMLQLSKFDKLITYSVLLSLVGLIIRIIYGVYCKRNFKECNYQFIIDKKMTKEITSFAGWNLMGSGAYLFNTQGINIAMNIFFGVTINAARGIATQVENVVRQFVANFTTALNPQITKSYASGNMDYMYTLVCRGSKYSYFLMLFFAVPFILEANMILNLWLKEVPEQTTTFLRLTIIGALCDILGNSTANACWATGKVKQYYLWVGTTGLLVFFISYGLFKYGFPAYSSYIVFIIIYTLLIFIKLHIIKRLISFPVRMFYRETLFRIIPVSIISFAISAIPSLILPMSLSRLFATALLSSCSLFSCIYILGLEKTERNLLENKWATIKNKLFNK